MTTDHLKVVPLDRGDLNDIPQLMRNMADEIERGEAVPGITAGCAVFVDGDGTPTVCGWGRTDDIHSIGLLTLGAEWLSAHRVQR